MPDSSRSVHNNVSDSDNNRIVGSINAEPR